MTRFGRFFGTSRRETKGIEVVNHWTGRVTPEQRAEVRVAIATWPPLTEAQRVKIAALFEPYQAVLMGGGKHPDRPS